MEVADEQMILQSLAIAVTPQDDDIEVEAAVLGDSVVGLNKDGVVEVTYVLGFDVGSFSASVGTRSLPIEIDGKFETPGNGGGVGGGYIYKGQHRNRVVIQTMI